MAVIRNSEWILKNISMIEELLRTKDKQKSQNNCLPKKDT